MIFARKGSHRLMLREMQRVTARRPLDGPSLFFGIKQQFQIVNGEQNSLLFACALRDGRC